MKTLPFLLIAFLVLTCSSCEKYLDEKPDKTLVVPSTVRDLQALLDDSYTMNLSITPSMPESSSDDFFLTGDAYNSNNEIARSVYTWSLKEYSFANDWSNAYMPVYNTNLCLEKIVTLPRTSQNAPEWDNVKGAALFYRSFYFLNLAWEFAKAYDVASASNDPGIVLRTGSDFNVKSERASVKATYELIIKDAKESIALLPANSIGVMRPSKIAADALLARTYLSMRLYDSAYLYANRALEANGVLIDYNQLDVNDANPFPRFDNPETIFYTEMNGSNGLHGTYQAFIDTVLYNSYDSNDLRKQAFFFESGGYHSFKGNYSKDPYTFFSGIARDEILLIRAECLARKNLLVEALADLNALLVKRWNNAIPYIPVTADNMNEAIDKILVERRKELTMRGLRWMDIKRLNKEERNIVPERLIDNTIFKLPPNDNRYALPIPSDIIRITGIAQN